MSYSQMYSFLEKLKTDEALRERVIAAEHATARDTMRLREELDTVAAANLECLERIAAEAGFDLSEDVARPAKEQVRPTESEMENLFCLFTCCLMVTSVWETEGAGGSGPH